MTAKITASADGLSGSLAVGANEAFKFKPVAGGLELSQDGITFQTVDTDGKVAFPQGRSSYRSGEVIQTIFAKDAGSNSIGSGGTLVNTTVANKTITPKSANSKIKVSVSVYLYGTMSLSAGGNFVNAQIYSASGGAPQGEVVSVGNTNGNISQQIATNTIIEHVFDNADLTPKSFSLFACNSLAGTTTEGGAVLQVWTLTEVQN